MNEIPGFPLSYLVVKIPNLTAIPAKGPKYPPGDSIRITRGLRGYTRWVRSHAPSGKVKTPPSNSIRITQGLEGYCWGPNIGVPNEVELITIKH